MSKKGHLTRIDCALDYREVFVPLERILEAIDAGQHVTRAREIESMNRRASSPGSLQGATLYFGSTVSDGSSSTNPEGTSQWQTEALV
ncbi:replication initiation factor domain-containing protein [Nitrospira sp. Nam74]